MPWSADFFEEVSADRHHGSSAVFDKFLALLLAFLRQEKELDSGLLAALPEQ